MFFFFFFFFLFFVIIITEQIQLYCLYSDAPTVLPLMMPRPPAPAALNGTISNMQIDYQRQPSGAVTENSINMKMTTSQEPLVEIYATLCQNVS